MSASGAVQRMLSEALALHRAGDLAGAERLYLQAISLQPGHAVATNHLAMILAQTGRAREAERRLERLIKTATDDAMAHLLLGRLMGQAGKTTRSLFLLRRATGLAAGREDIWMDAIAALGEQSRVAEAGALAEEGLRRLPRSPMLAVQAGLAFMHAGDDPAARRWFEAALAVDPDHAMAMYQLATVLEAKGETVRALRLFRAAQARDASRSLPPLCLGDLELRIGDVPQAIASLEAQLRLVPADPVAISNRLMAAQYAPGVTARSLLDLHRLWQQRIGDAIAPLPPAVPAAPQAGRLRVGLVSGDLRMHAVGLMTIAGIEGLDRTRLHLSVYADETGTDAIAARFRAAADDWRDIAGWSDARLAQAVRADGIDVLIDMAGHTTNIRLAAFALRPAPVQLSWAGYFGTTGCAAIDGLIVDRHLVPAGEEAEYTEAVMRLPDGYLCYDRPAEAGAVPVRDGGPLQFAAFHNPAKINADVIALWSEILQAPACRDGVIHFVYAGFEDDEVQARVAGWFAGHGIGPERLRFSGRLTRTDYFVRLGQMDIALDPFPFSGGVTTCDALWMGVPVVTLPGQSVAGRHSTSHLHAAGQARWVARDAADYRDIVGGLARDRARLAAIQAGLRDDIAGSALCDGARFGRGLQGLLWDAWRARAEDTVRSRDR